MQQHCLQLGIQTTLYQHQKTKYDRLMLQHQRTQVAYKRQCMYLHESNSTKRRNTKIIFVIPLKHSNKAQPVQSSHAHQRFSALRLNESPQRKLISADEHERHRHNRHAGTCVRLRFYNLDHVCSQPGPQQLPEHSECTDGIPTQDSRPYDQDNLNQHALDTADDKLHLTP